MSSWRAIALFVLGSSVACATDSVDNAWTKVRMRKFSFRMRDFKAPSGLRIIVEEDHSAPVAGVVTVVGVGSSADPIGKEGIAHFVEHMEFRMKPFGDDPSTLWELLPESGAAEFNAYTWLDETVYYEFGPKDALPKILHLEGARMVEPLKAIEKKTLDTEREVVRNELRERGETFFTSSMYGWMQEALYPSGHAYHRPVIGTHTSLSAIGLEDVQRFAQQHYRLDNMTMFIIGDVELEHVEKMLAQTVPFLYGDPTKRIAVPATRLAETAPAVPDPPEHEMYRYQGPVATPEVWVGWSLPGAFRTDQALLDFISSLADDMANEVYREDDDVASVRAETLPGVRSTMLICRVLLREGSHPERSAEHIINELSKLWANTNDSRAAFRQNNRFVYGLNLAANEMALTSENIVRRAEDAATFAHFTGNPALYSSTLQRMSEIQRTAVQQYASQYLNRDRARVLYITPIPPSMRAAGVATGFGAAPDDEDADARLPEYSAEQIRSMVKPPGFGAFRREMLKNGLEVIVAPHPSIPAVTVHLGLHGGNSSTQPGIAGLAQHLAVPWSTRHGNFYEHGALARVTWGQDMRETTIHAASGNLRDVLAILTDQVTSMRVPSEYLHPLRKYLYPVLRKFDAQPDQVGDRMFWRALFGTHPYGDRSTIADVEQTELGPVEVWIEKLFAPRNGVVAIVGDLDPNAASKLAHDWLGDWKADGGEMPALPPPSPKAAPVKLAVTHRPGASQGEVRIGCLLPPATPKQAVMYDVMGSMVAAHLFKSIRTQLGASYGIHPDVGVLRGGASYLAASGNIDNGSLPAALGVIKKYWDELPNGDFSEKEMNWIRYQAALGFNMRFRTSGAIANEIVRVRNLGWPLESVDQFGDNLATITREEMARAFKVCHDTTVLSIVGDEVIVTNALKSAGWRP